MSSYSPEQLTARPSFVDTCARCASPDLFIKEQGPHLGLFCRSCNLWQRWVRKSEAHRYLREPRVKVELAQPKLTSTAKSYPEVTERIGFVHTDLTDLTNLTNRLEKLERRFAGYDRQLTILTQAVLGCGVLKGQTQPKVDVDPERIDRLVRELAEEEGR